MFSLVWNYCYSLLSKGYLLLPLLDTTLMTAYGNNLDHFISYHCVFFLLMVMTDDKLSVNICCHFHDVLIAISTKGEQLLNIQPLWDCKTSPFLCPWESLMNLNEWRGILKMSLITVAEGWSGKKEAQLMNYVQGQANSVIVYVPSLQGRPNFTCVQSSCWHTLLFNAAAVAQYKQFPTFVKVRLCDAT